jgi:hypothetical protein
MTRKLPIQGTNKVITTMTISGFFLILVSGAELTFKCLSGSSTKSFNFPEKTTDY